MSQPPTTASLDPAMRQSIIERMLLAKLLLGQGLTLCGTSDHMRFSQGVLSLQDAVELALGSMASFIGAKLEPKTSFYDYFRKINEKLKADNKPELPSQKELSLLNEARVKVKHHGLLQRPEDQRKHTILVEPFIRHLCDRMGLSLDDLSLSDAINSEKVRNAVKEAERKLGAPDFKACVQALTVAQHELFGYRFNLGPYREVDGLGAPPPMGIWWEEFESGDEVWLLRHGIDVGDFYRLRALIPEWGVTGKTRELRFLWEGDFCHLGNWNRENLRWAANFTIDMALKLERPNPADGLMRRSAYCSHRITAVKDVAKFYNHTGRDDADWDSVMSRFAPPQEVILTLPKGQSITGFAWRTKKEWATWTVRSADLKGGGGVVSAYDVEIQEIPITPDAVKIADSGSTDVGPG